MGTRCCGSPCSDLRRAAKPQAGTWGWRDEAGGRQGPCWGGPQPPGAARPPCTLILPCLIPTVPPGGCIGCQQAQLLSMPSAFVFFPCQDQKSLSHSTEGQAWSRERRADPAAGTALPAHPTCPKTSPGVTAGDSWELPRVSLAWAQLVPPITCELYGEQRVEDFRARGVQKLHARRRRIAQQLAGSKVHCEKACPEVRAALSLPACR